MGLQVQVMSSLVGLTLEQVSLFLCVALWTVLSRALQTKGSTKVAQSSRRIRNKFSVLLLMLIAKSGTKNDGGKIKTIINSDLSERSMRIHYEHNNQGANHDYRGS